MSDLVVMSNGMGVESQAIFERWLAEPETRPFTDWKDLIVVIAQVGEEHRDDTIKHMEERTLPKLRELRVRLVEVARRGHLEEDGIVVLQDSRNPERLHPDGCYKLSDELLASGTVPQFGGEHRCAMKFKAFCIETWLAWEFRGTGDAPIFHVFGYNADETSRAANSETHIRVHNEERAIEAPKTPLMIFGFNSEEIGRIERAKLYDGPSRIGHYPLQIWGWNRDKCVAYILERSGILWVKSACSFCPFCREASKGEDAAVARWRLAPEQTAHGLLVEFNSLCFNPRGHLFKAGSMLEVVRRKQVTEVLAIFEDKLAGMAWAFYRVRRIYSKKGKAIRCVERLDTGTRDAMKSLVADRASTESDLEIVASRGIDYAFFQHRPEVYPAAEGFYVAAPAFVQTKLRGPIEKFNERWESVLAGRPAVEEVVE